VHDGCVPVRDTQVLWEVLEGELLLCHPGTATVMCLDQVASLIWRLCDGKRTVGQIVAMLAEAFPEAGSTLAEDVTAGLMSFQTRGLVRLT
jgi:Coenzyme PQQ synthesis protein D (PqqD)